MAPVTADNFVVPLGINADSADSRVSPSSFDPPVSREPRERFPPVPRGHQSGIHKVHARDNGYPDPKSSGQNFDVISVHTDGSSSCASDSDSDSETISVSEAPVKWAWNRRADPTKQPVAIEAMCGCARYSSSLKKAGFKTIGVDYKGNKDEPMQGVKVVWLDLATSHGQKEFFELVDSENVVYVHFAPPCGTASQARQIRRSFEVPGVGLVDPKPLRSLELPDGLPNLSLNDNHRVQVANELYKFVANAVVRLHSLGIAWSIENPSRSLMWQTSWFKELQLLSEGPSDFKYSSVDFFHCMHGGKRPKETLLIYAIVDFSTLHAVCNHRESEHLPWGLTKSSDSLFATAEERRYPLLLCKRMARRVADLFMPDKSAVSLALEDINDAVHNKGQPRRGAGKLIPEFAEIKTNISLTEDEFENLELALASKSSDYPDGTRIICKRLDKGENGQMNKITFDLGIGWIPSDFVTMARLTGHPLDEPIQLPIAVILTLKYLAESGPRGVDEMRSNNIAWMKQRAEELRKEEEFLHKSIHPDVEVVVSNKNILLFQELLVLMNYDDMAVVALLKEGIRLTGTLGRVGIWKPDQSRTARSSVSSLWSQARNIQSDILSTSRSHEEHEDILWEETMKEVHDGSIRGPFTVPEIEKLVGPRWTAAKRFAVVQKDKVRPIDDFSASGLNATFGTEEKASMRGVDQVVAWSRAWAHSISGDKVVFTEIGGAKHEFVLHKDWTKSSWLDLVGRVADLKKAYKQLAASPIDKCFSLIAVKEPGGNVKLFQALALMFGATAAVYSFLRFSRALSAIGNWWLRITVLR